MKWSREKYTLVERHYGGGLMHAGLRYHPQTLREAIQDHPGWVALAVIYKPIDHDKWLVLWKGDHENPRFYECEEAARASVLLRLS